ncbi:sigma-70 family RNA polymerase sigma factor [Rhodanobacter glycinis]|uniref:Sigma-70 family RNA polymerase sigma factor n=2 Tax=Rhodanobacter glycinis TaxID=582702 RepID=A0A502BUZ5_9GAMM|nr:sigma-70 family RNA polymerase sigma factor [Rhodanobacter glycinis]
MQRWMHASAWRGSAMPDTRQVPTVESTDVLFIAVYARLKAMAARQLAYRRNATLDTTELVHELYLRMGQRQSLQFEHPAQFFSYAARAMRHLLINRARDRLRLCAGGQWMRVTLDDRDLKLALDTAEQALALDAALDALEQTDARAAQVVELRFFAGLSLEQVGETLGLARRTIDRDWRFARAYIKARME